MYQDRFFHVLRLTGDFDKLGFAHASITTQTRRRECIRARKPNLSTRVHPRSEEMDGQMCYSDGRASWAAVNRRKRKQCAAKECTCCFWTGVCIRCPQAKPVLRDYASVFAKRSDGRTCAGAMDGHTWAAVNGRNTTLRWNGFADCDRCIFST